MSNQNSNADKDKPKTLKQIKKQEQVRFKQYWKQLQRENCEFIHTMTQEIKQSNKQINIQHIKTLELLLMEPKMIADIIPKLKQLFKELMKMLKGTIKDALDNMSASQREVYQQISQKNIKLVENTKKTTRYSNRFSDNTIEKLFHLDVASLMLKQNQMFKKQWWHFENLWTEDDLKEISLMHSKSLGQYKNHQYYSDSLRYNNNHKKINDIITISALVRIRIRLANFLNQYGQFPYLIDIEKERQQRQRAERENNDYQSDFKFNFSQIANLSIKNQLQQPPSNCKAQFYQIIRLIMKQRSLWEKSYLILLVKIKYKVSIRAILQSLGHFQQMDEQQFMQHFEQAVQEENLAKSDEFISKMMYNNYMYFRDKWKYIFLKSYTFQEAFEKSGMKEQFNQVNYSYSKNYYIHLRQQYYLLAASLSSFSDYTKYVQALLFLESKIHPLIAIKTYELTYSNTSTELILQEQTESQSSTLLLATVNSKVLFFYLLKGKVNSYQYFQKIKQGIKSNPIHQKFLAILFEQDFKQNYSKFLKETKNFVKYMAYQYDSRAYISCFNQYYEQNALIFTNLSCQLKRILKKVKKDKFYENLENEVKSVLTIYK